MAVAGASRYLNAATLTNVRGIVPSTPSVLGQGGGGGVSSILEAGRNLFATRGIGLSSRGRSINQQFLNNGSAINQMLSLTAGTDGNIEGALVEIAGLRSRVPDSQVARDLPDLRGTEVDEEA